jgi:hypothetical protein
MISLKSFRFILTKGNKKNIKFRQAISKVCIDWWNLACYYPAKHIGVPSDGINHEIIEPTDQP